ncbi:MAG: aspartyl protease family protein [Candidatus Omnitrophota bacterium]
MPIKQFSFTQTYENIANVIKSKVVIHPAFDPSKPGLRIEDYPGVEFWAIWDTGATKSLITNVVVEKLKLKPIGVARVCTASGENISNKYIVNIGLPNKVGVPEVIVTEGILTDSVDVLIGMDVIVMGDFAITNKNGKTVFSFRMPSLETIDFVKNPYKETPIKLPPKLGRNSKCPCGSGKKYKQCCDKTRNPA